jgi:hypothetical protein
MIFKLAEAAEKSWRSLDGHNQFPKVILRCKVRRRNRDRQIAGSSRCRLNPPSPRFGVALRAPTGFTAYFLVWRLHINVVQTAPLNGLLGNVSLIRRFDPLT